MFWADASTQLPDLEGCQELTACFEWMPELIWKDVKTQLHDLMDARTQSLDLDM